MNDNKRLHRRRTERCESDRTGRKQTSMTVNADKVLTEQSVDVKASNFSNNVTENYKCINKTAESLNINAKRENLARKIVNIVYCLVFVLFVATAFVIVSVHMADDNKPTYSEYEKRNLEPLPELTLESLADGSFTDSFDRFYADNFPFREELVESATYVKRFRGIRAFNSYSKQVIQGDDDIYSSGDLEIVVDEGKFANADKIEIDGIDAEDVSSVDTQQDITEEQQSDLPFESEQAENLGESLEESGAAVDGETQTVSTTEVVANSDAQKKTEPVVLQGEKRDTIYLIGDTAYEYFRGSEKTSDDYINVINTYAKYIPQGVNIYTLVIPTHPEFGLEGSDRTVSKDQKPVIEYIGNNLDSRVTFVNPYDRLYTHYKNGEYLYFRTDHHWTIRGA